MASLINPPARPLLFTSREIDRPRTWAELEQRCVDAARAAGEDPDKALRAIRSDTILVRLLRAELGLQMPRKKPGPAARKAWDQFVLVVVDSFKRDGLRGAALWERAHKEVATNDAFMGEFRNIQPEAIERQYHRLKRAEKS